MKLQGSFRNYAKICDLFSFGDLSPSMNIQVKTVGTLKTLEEGSRIETLELAPGSSVAQAIALLKIQDWEIGFIKINDQTGSRDSILKENDELILIAPLVGG
jgi:ThiS family